MSCNQTVTHICFVNYSESEKEYECRTTINAFRLYYGYIPLPLSVIELLITVLFLLSVGDAIRKRKVSRKSYLLLANRAIGDLIRSIGNVIYHSVFIANDVVDNVGIEQIRDIRFQGGYWLATISYVALCFLKLFAVLRPFIYIKTVTLRRTFNLVLASWLFATVFIFTPLVLLYVIPLYSGCKEEACTGNLQLVMVHNILIIAVYFLIVLLFTFTAFIVNRKRKGGKAIAASRNSTKSINRDKVAPGKNPLERSATQQKKASPRFGFSMWKLTLNVGSFVIFNSAYVLYGIYMLSLPEDVDNDCELQKIENFIPVMTKKMTLRIFQLFRIILDPIVSFVTDQAIRRSMLIILHLDRFKKVSNLVSGVSDVSAIKD